MPTHTTGTERAPASAAALPADPFTALQFHYGMLLGVDDLETLAANPRGKMRLHSAWLHREGVIWGFGVKVDSAKGELRVEPGLAVDALGRELRLDQPMCLDLATWYGAHETVFNPAITPDPSSGKLTFDAHVVIRFRACLARPVPAIGDPCGEGRKDVAWSRAQETVELLLRPDVVGAKPLPYPRLRLMFGLRAPDAASAEDADIVTRRDATRGLADAERASEMLALFRELAAKDTQDLAPFHDADTWSAFPEGEDSVVLLAQLTKVGLTKSETGYAFDASVTPAVDIAVRRSHVATHTLQELLCGDMASTATPAPAAVPRITSCTLSSDTEVKLEATVALEETSVVDEAFSISSWDAGAGWKVEAFTSALSADQKTITLKLNAVPAASATHLRVIARGSGPTPIVATVSGEPVALMGGMDFVAMKRRS